MQRLGEIFEQRVIGLLGELVTEAEMKDMHYEFAPAVFPMQQPNGQVAPAFGFNVAITRPTMGIGNHVLMMYLCQDPYTPDPELKLQLGSLIKQLRDTVDRVNAQGANGHAELSPSGLIIPPGRH